MSPLRVALLTPTFWPVANRLLVAVRGLAERCQLAGAQVTLFTEKLEPDWASRFRFRDCNVVRIERPASRPWGRGRFSKALVRALNDELTRKSFDAAGVVAEQGGTSRWDAVIVCDWPEALFALEGEASRISSQLLFWFDRPLPSEARGNGSTSRAWRSGLSACHGLLSPHPRAAEWVIGVCESACGVVWIPDGLADYANLSGSQGNCVVPTAGPPLPARDAARKTLAEIHPLLNFERHQLLAVCASELDGDPGINDLLNAWRQLRRDEPRAQLIIVGDGPQARSVWSRIHDWHLQGNVVMPGCFDDYQELLRAADLYLHPLRSDRSCPFLSLALQLGTPCLLSDASPWSVELVADRDAWIYPAGSSPALLECLRKAAAEFSLRQAVGLAGMAAVKQAMARTQPFSDWLSVKTATPVAERAGANS